jgi:AraC-like DNA-binding protein
LPLTFIKSSCLSELRIAFAQLKRGMERRVNSKLYYRSKLTEILHLFSELYDVESRSGSRRLSIADIEAIGRVKEIIGNDVSRTPKIAELARSTGTSAVKLQNDFKSAQGCTIHEYIQHFRMVAALREMENTDKPFYVIAREVGFKNPGHFSDVFKKTYGVLPSEYAKLSPPDRTERARPGQAN